MAKDHLKSINVSALSHNSGVQYTNKLAVALRIRSGKVLTPAERQRVLESLYKSYEELKNIFSDAESL